MFRQDKQDNFYKKIDAKEIAYIVDFPTFFHESRISFSRLYLEAEKKSR